MENANEIYVAFHIGRGGRFHNAGHVSYMGEYDFQKLISLNYDNLYEHNRDEKGRFCKPFMDDASGKLIVEQGHIHDMTGRLDFDGTYDTDYCCLVEECNQDELQIIANSGKWLSHPLRDYLEKHLED